MKDSLNIAIAGATGYIGLQLIKILLKHPNVKIQYLCATKSIGKSIKNFDKTISDKKIPKISNISEVKWFNIDVLLPLYLMEKLRKLQNEYQRV